MTKTLSLTALLLLSACTVGPSYDGPPKVASDAAARGHFVRATDPALSTAPGVARWWEDLGDPLLTQLVDDALSHSPTIDVAQARIRQARGTLSQQQAGQYPSVSANGTYLHATLPGTSLGTSDGSDADSSSSSSSLDFYNAGLTASWEPDLFGGLRRSVEQSRAQIAQSFANLADAQVSLSAQVAQAYVNLRDTQERSRLNAQSSALQRRALDLTRQRYAAGTASALDVERLQNQLETTDAQNVPLAAQIDEYRDQLAVLTGREPGALDTALTKVVAVPLPPAEVAVGDPAALIARRPDIRAAERALAANTAAVGVNKAKQLPGLRFMGILGLGGTSPGDLLDLDKLTTLVAPMLNWSFLDFGKNRAMVRQSEGKRDEAAATYRKTVLEALQDAETSLSRFGNTRLQLAQLGRAEASAARAAQLNGQRVHAGTSTLIDQLDIERRQLSAAIAVAQGKAQLTNSYIAVAKALGLGWTEPLSGVGKKDSSSKLKTDHRNRQG